EESRYIFGVSGAASVYRRRMVEDISMDGQFYDESYFAYKEDVDVAWRAQLLGWKSYYLAEAKALHERGWKYEGRRSRKQIPLFLRRHSYQNRIFTIIKNEPAGWKMFLSIPRLIGLEFVQVGYILLLEQGLLRCWATILRRMPELLRQRSALWRRIAERKGKT
ncbi:glycosyltransferase family 2 protein, partial [Paenibacillus sepulcri]|nr:glycosyltransferase family 2 protein [Paenibacillus sepulcri]